MTGKERKELTQRNEDKGVLAAIAKPLKRHKTALEGMEKNIDRAMARVERLEQAAAKGKEKPLSGRKSKPQPQSRNSPRKKPRRKRRKRLYKGRITFMQEFKARAKNDAENDP